MLVFLENIIAPVFYKLLYMSVTALVIGMIIMLIRRFADKRFSPFWKYAMWVLVLAALLVPWRPQSNLAVMNTTERLQEVSFREEYQTAQIEYRDAQIVHVGSLLEAPEPSEQLIEAKAKVDSLHVKTLIFDSIIPLVWLFGMVIMGLFMILGSLRLGMKIKRATVPIDTERYESILQSCKKILGIKRRVRIVLQGYVKTPALFGLLRPKIILPEYVESLSDEHLEYVILHELSHLKRGDGIVNTSLLALQTIYWFNPLTWFLFKFIREDMELANDAYVLKGMNSEQQKEYSLSLVEVLAGYRKPTLAPRLLCMVDSEKNMTRRINMIKLGEFFKRRKIIIAIAGLLVIGVTAMLFLTAGATGKRAPSNWDTFTFPHEQFENVSFEINEESKAYNPDYIAISAQLMNTELEAGLGYEQAFVLVKQVKSEWKVVPFTNEVQFDNVSYYDLELGSSIDYTISPKMLAVKLDEGQYRIVTNVWSSDTPDLRAEHGEDVVRVRRTVWAEFKIDKNAPKQEAFKTSSEWFGNSDGKEMTIDELREIVRNIPGLTMKDLMKYRWMNVSSTIGNYNALFSCDNGSLQVIANSDYVISHITFKIKEADTALDLLTESARLDDYINGKYIPVKSEQSSFQLSLEQSISKAILEKYAANMELHKTLYTEENNGITKAYVMLDVNSMGWSSGHFIVSSGSGRCCILSFEKDDSGNFIVVDIKEADPNGSPQLYAEFVSKTGIDKGYTRPDKPREIMLYNITGDDSQTIGGVNNKFGKYLPKDIFTQEYMPDFKEVFSSDGTIFYYWSKTKNSQTVRKIELELCDEGVARFYFKDYGLDDGYVYNSQRISKEDAGELAKNFAKDFWADGDKLSFKNIGQGYMTPYDPGNVENWQAEYKSKVYNVMVNLRMGYIVYADIS